MLTFEFINVLSYFWYNSHHRMRLFLSAVLFLCSVLFFSGCSKDNSTNTPPVNNTPLPVPVSLVPSITSIVPNQGAALIKDTIYGKNFSTTLNDNKVLFSGIQASVLSASANQLIVTVPQNGTTGSISVTVGGQTAAGPVFTYQATPVVTPAPDDSVMVTTFAGTGVYGRDDGAVSTATFGFVWDIFFDKSGTLWVADGSSNRVRKIANGTVSSLMGLNTFQGQSKIELIGVAVDANNLVYVTDIWSLPIRTINAAGTVSNFVGNLYAGTADGTGTNAFFRSVRTMVFDKAGNLFVADVGNNNIRKVTPSGVVTTFAGNITGFGEYGDGTGTAAYFSGPQGLAIDKDDNLYVADEGNSRIRKITPSGVVTTIAGNGIGTNQDGYGLTAGIGGPYGIAVDNRNGNIYVAQYGMNRIRKIRPDGYVSTIAGTGLVGSVDGPGRKASFNGPSALAVDSAGNLYVADEKNYKIRKITFK